MIVNCIELWSVEIRIEKERWSEMMGNSSSSNTPDRMRSGSGSSSFAGACVDLSFRTTHPDLDR